ncbi:MAG: hypothetical protein VXZ67_08955 [Pseudomonadota bacterium]|nr:hypothetical protein [Pseudomonadota bacterium]
MKIFRLDLLKSGPQARYLKNISDGRALNAPIMKELVATGTTTANACDQPVPGKAAWTACATKLQLTLQGIIY